MPSIGRCWELDGVQTSQGAATTQELLFFLFIAKRTERGQKWVNWCAFGQFLKVPVKGSLCWRQRPGVRQGEAAAETETCRSKCESECKLVTAWGCYCTSTRCARYGWGLNFDAIGAPTLQWTSVTWHRTRFESIRKQSKIQHLCQGFTTTKGLTGESPVESPIQWNIKIFVL